jgi:hypothetical protein
VGTIAVYALLAVTPAAAFWGLVKGCEWLARYETPAEGPVPPNRSIEQLARDLSRLAREQRRLRDSDPFSKATRLRSVMLAYDDTLLAACLALGLPCPNHPPLPDSVRLETELALTGQGLNW